MEIGPLAKVLIIMNNYFHDVATAMLLSSAVILALLGRRARADGGVEALKWFAGAYRTLTRVAVWSIAWIIVGGIPRTIFFNEVEWNMSDPSNRYLFAALMVKHAAMWLAVGAGVVLWSRMRSLVRSVEAQEPSA
jgi:hypothetical protein